MASATVLLQDTVNANGNGTPYAVDRFDGAQIVEIVESGGGTCSVTLQGTFDGTRYYNLGFQQTDANASLARTVGAISVTANMAHVYQVLDPYAQVRAVVASVAGGAVVTVKLFAIG